MYKTFALADSLEAMMSDENHYLYYWDSTNGHVYVKVDMTEIDDYPDVYTNVAHTADGMTLYPIAWKNEGGATCHMQNMQQFSMQHAACSMQHATCNMQHATCNRVRHRLGGPEC